MYTWFCEKMQVFSESIFGRVKGINWVLLCRKLLFWGVGGIFVLMFWNVGRVYWRSMSRASSASSMGMKRLRPVLKLLAAGPHPATVMPTMLPFLSSKGPPEFPLWMSTSACRKLARIPARL